MMMLLFGEALFRSCCGGSFVWRKCCCLKTILHKNLIFSTVVIGPFTPKLRDYRTPITKIWVPNEFILLQHSLLRIESSYFLKCLRYE